MLKIHLSPLIPLLLCSILAGSIPAQVNMERFRRDTEKAGLEGSADFDLSVMTGNTDFQMLGLGSRVNYNWGKSYTFVVLNGGIGWNKGERFMDNAMAHLRHVLTLNRRLQNEWFLQFDQNHKRKLDAREVFGVGVRAKVVTNKKIKMRSGMAWMYERERYDLADEMWHPRQMASHRLSSYLTLESHAAEHFSLLNVTYFQPILSDWRDHRILSENAMTVGLSRHLDLKLSFTLRFDSKPPRDIKKLDTASKSALSLRF